MIINRLTELEGRMDEDSENFNRDIGTIRKYQIEITELKNTMTELKNTQEGFNSRQ